MNKKEFINIIDFEDENVVSNIYNKMLLAEKINKEVFTSEFYPPCIWKKISRVGNLVKIVTHNYGVFDEAERRMISFNNNSNLKYPVQLLKIICTSKFTKVEHKDYLGSIMSLGIRREKIGEIIVKDNIGYCVACSTISDYIIQNLKCIKKSPCNIEIIDINLETVPKINFKEFTIIVASNRVDVVVSAIVGKSRNVVNNMIKSGKVLIDYSKVTDKSQTISSKTVISIKQFGKFIVEGELGKTQRGRIKILVKKYD